MNKVMLFGRVGAQPELRKTNGGTSVTELRVATRGFSNGEETTDWHSVVVWDKQAETVERYVGKGEQVVVEGSLRTRSWEDRDGNKRSKTEVHAHRVHFVSGGEKKRVQVRGSDTDTRASQPTGLEI